MSDAIDWAEVRRRIALTPVVVPPQHPKYYERPPPPEALEKHRRAARERQRVRYKENKEYELARVRA